MDYNVKEISTLETKSEILTLTDKYVYITTKKWGSIFCRIIFLKDISTIDYGNKSYPILWFFAAISLIATVVAFISEKTDGILEGMMATIFFVIAYFCTKQSILSITAHNDKSINFVLSGDMKSAEDFVKKTVEAKSDLNF